MLAAIPYTTFPQIDLGFISLRTFGVMVALGVLAGATIAARWAERWGIPSDEMIRVATRMVIVGIIASRLTWVLTHWDRIESPIDVIAVWEGGLQFTGGFIGGVLAGIPTFRKWAQLTRWRMLDGMALALTVGLAIGRIGCYSVGEHLGEPTSFFLATRYDGGTTREPVQQWLGQAIHNTSLYEILHLTVLAAVLVALMLWRRAVPSTAMGVFLVWYGAARFGTDFLRAFDRTALGLTGAQWAMIAVFAAGVWVLTRVRPRLARVEAASSAPLSPGAGEGSASSGTGKDEQDTTP